MSFGGCGCGLCLATTPKNSFDRNWFLEFEKANKAFAWASDEFLAVERNTRFADHVCRLRVCEVMRMIYDLWTKFLRDWLK